MIHYLSLLLLICSGCGESRRTSSEDVHFRSQPIQTEPPKPRPPHEKSEKHSQSHTHAQTSKPLSQQKCSPSECIEKRDMGIELCPFTRQKAKQLGLLDMYLADLEFDKWLIVFHDIPESHSYSIEQKRLLQQEPDSYHPHPNTPSSQAISACKKFHRPAGLVLSVRGYLPGEKVAIRLTGQNVHREIVFYPRPLLLKRENNSLLAKVTLLCPHPRYATYELDVCGVHDEEKYTLISCSGEEKLTHALQGPITSSISPAVLGQASGTAIVTLSFKNDISYNIQLPWGDELVKYMYGKK